MHALVTPIGLNPLRIVRAACTLAPQQVILMSTPETAHLHRPLRVLLHELDAGGEPVFVMCDPYEERETFDALQRACEEVETGTVLIGGGTKTMIGAQTRLGLIRGWSTALMHDRQHLIRFEDEDVPLAHLPRNLTPQEIAQLHRVHRLHGRPQSARARSKDLHWLAFAARKPDGISTGHAERWESAVNALIRALVPEHFDVYAQVTCVLRSPHEPTKEAVQPTPMGYRPRMFELDGLVISGSRLWGVETKLGGGKLLEARTSLAEVVERTRHIGGDFATTVLVLRSDEQVAKLRSEASPFELSKVHIVGSRELAEACDAVLRGGDVTSTAMGQIFR